mmetsp:Transcript_10092/g.28757  ORF Transcript_10092/g.28757 Transcript_10092/m.28757 type:complete len:297 (+) Transcript_10092:930-1820(+)
MPTPTSSLPKRRKATPATHLQKQPPQQQSPPTATSTQSQTPKPPRWMDTLSRRHRLPLPTETEQSSVFSFPSWDRPDVSSSKGKNTFPSPWPWSFGSNCLRPSASLRRYPSLTPPYPSRLPRSSGTVCATRGIQGSWVYRNSASKNPECCRHCCCCHSLRTHKPTTTATEAATSATPLPLCRRHHYCQRQHSCADSTSAIATSTMSTWRSSANPCNTTNGCTNCGAMDSTRTTRHPPSDSSFSKWNGIITNWNTSISSQRIKACSIRPMATPTTTVLTPPTPTSTNCKNDSNTSYN